MMCVNSAFSSAILRICTAPAPLNSSAMKTAVSTMANYVTFGKFEISTD